jgi:hypothetical protein
MARGLWSKCLSPFPLSDATQLIQTVPSSQESTPVVETLWRRADDRLMAEYVAHAMIGAGRRARLDTQIASQTAPRSEVGRLLMAEANTPGVKAVRAGQKANRLRHTKPIDPVIDPVLMGKWPMNSILSGAAG